MLAGHVGDLRRSVDDDVVIAGGQRHLAMQNRDPMNNSILTAAAVALQNFAQPVGRSQIADNDTITGEAWRESETARSAARP